MGIVSRGNQYLGMFGARQQLLEFLILTRLGVDLADALEGKARLLDAAPLRTRGLLTRRTSLAAAREALKQARYASSASSAERPAHASTIAT